MAIRYIAGGQFVGATSDWDYPGLAERNGWSIRRVQKRNGKTVVLGRAAKVDTGDKSRAGFCAHAFTDGTVTCKECGITASEFIAAAGDWLHEHSEPA